MSPHPIAIVAPALAIALLAASPAAAQPSLSLPGSVFAAGPDFATDTLGDPWDFNNVDDLSPFPDEQNGWLSSSQARTIGRGALLNNGRFQATADSSGGNKVSMLFRGGAGLVNTGRTGAFDHMAIPTGRYGKLAIKMRLTNPGPPPNQIFGIWYHRTYGAPDEATNAGLVLFGEPVNGWAIYIVDLQTRQFLMQDGSVRTGQLGSPYSSSGQLWQNSQLVRGFEFRPQGSSGYTVPVEVDWVRLTARDGTSNAVSMTVNYSSCSGTYVLRVADSEGVPFAVARGSATGNGSITFNHGVLAPGAYTATLACGNGTSAGQPFTINAPPAVTVIDPDVTGGADFATDVLGNPWDMADAADVPVIQGVTNVSVVNEASLPALQATATSSGDPAVTLLNGGTALINSRRYRKLTFTLSLDTAFGLDGSRGEGSVARVFWGSRSTSDGANMTTSNDMMVWPGRNTYTIDLGALSIANGGIESECGGCLGDPWLTRSVRFLRLDPHEATTGVTFRLANVRLSAADEVALGSTFNVRFRIDDPENGSNYVAQVYLDADRDPASGLLLLGTLNNVPPRTVVSFPWTASGVGPGEYQVYVRVTENRGGLQEVRGGYAGAPLRVYSSGGTLPRLTVSSPAPGSSQPTPFSISGCAYDEGNASGINVDEVAVMAIAGSGVTGAQAGSTQVLGVGGPLGNLLFPASCPTASGAFANSGFSITGVYGLAQGNWTLRVMARSTISNSFTTTDVPITVVTAAGAPSNFTASAVGNMVTVSFSAPTSGPRVGGYVLEGAYNQGFVPAAFNVFVPSPGTYSGHLASGTYYLRVVSLEPIGARIAASPGVRLVVGPQPPTPPGAPSLTLVQASNPVTLRWAPGSGGAPSSYTLHAGTSPGASNLAVAPMGTATSISANAPVGTRVYVRVVAANAGGTATSNEVSFTVGVPSVPAAPQLSPASVSGSNVTLSWTSVSGAAAYTVLARQSVNGPILASLPVGGATSVSVPASPGTFVVSVVAVNGAGSSAESNKVTVIVR